MRLSEKRVGGAVAELEPTEALRARYLGAADGAVYLIRPDQHVAARWDNFDAGEVAAALARATGRG